MPGRISFFPATAESVLHDGYECWKTNTSPLHVAINTSQYEHITNKCLQGALPSASKELAVRRMRRAGHCHRNQELQTKKLVVWEKHMGILQEDVPHLP